MPGPHLSCLALLSNSFFFLTTTPAHGGWTTFIINSFIFVLVVNYNQISGLIPAISRPDITSFSSPWSKTLWSLLNTTFQEWIYNQNKFTDETTSLCSSLVVLSFCFQSTYSKVPVSLLCKYLFTLLYKSVFLIFEE